MTYQALLIAAVLCLSACGSKIQAPPLEMDPALSAETMKQAIATITDRSDHLLATAILVSNKTGTFPGDRLVTTCHETTCRTVDSEHPLSSVWVTSQATSRDITAAAVTVEGRLGGVPIGTATGHVALAATLSTDYRIYGGWLDNSYFGVLAYTMEGPVAGEDWTGYRMLVGVSVGQETGSNPQAGSATWTGAMVGLDEHRPDDPLRGEATLTFDLTSQAMDVAFTEIYSQNAVYYQDMTWSNLAMFRGRFQGQGLNGAFYGDAHEEVGGVFERGSIVGAFGATRP